MILFYSVLLVMTASLMITASDNLPSSCDNIPQLLCCIDRIILKCLTSCADYINDKCPHKFNLIINSSPSPYPSPHQSPPKGEREHPKAMALLTREEYPRRIETKPQTGVRARSHAASSPLHRFVKRPRMASAKVNSNTAHLGAIEGFTDLSRPGESRSHFEPEMSWETAIDGDQATFRCGTELAEPPYAPCLPRETVDDLFMSCCQQHIPSECRDLCTYESEERLATELLFQTVQYNGCDMKYMSAILYCANRNRDNRHCCHLLGMDSAELGVGERCLRMCNIGGESGDYVGSLEMNDLVCLSNWNVIMYCARAGLRTIN